VIGPWGPRPRPRRPGAGVGASGAGGGAGPRSGWKRYALWVTGSTAMVFAPANVGTVATTVYVSGESWWTTVTLPSPPFGMSRYSSISAGICGLGLMRADDSKY